MDTILTPSSPLPLLGGDERLVSDNNSSPTQQSPFPKTRTMRAEQTAHHQSLPTQKQLGELSAVLLTRRELLARRDAHNRATSRAWIIAGIAGTNLSCNSRQVPGVQWPQVVDKLQRQQFRRTSIVLLTFQLPCQTLPRIRRACISACRGTLYTYYQFK